MRADQLLPFMLPVLVACGTERTRSIQPRDAGTARDGGGGVDGGANGPWSWCPSAADAVTDPSWTHQVTVTEAARLCAYGGDVKETYAKAEMVQLIPGTYALPTAEGTYDLTLPMCTVDRAGAGVSIAGGGSLTVSREPLLGDIRVTYRYQQPLEDGELSIEINTWDFTDRGMPTLVMDQDIRHGSYPDDEMLYQRNGTDYYFPCAESASGRNPATIDFDRGSLTVETFVFALAGPSSPAALVRATGNLDGTSFDIDDYFQLGHRPDHHNWGGGFLVMFDAPIGDVCGLEAAVPSPDGSFWVDDPAAWTLDCNLQVIDTLDNVRPNLGP